MLLDRLLGNLAADVRDGDDLHTLVLGDPGQMCRRDPARPDNADLDHDSILR